MKKYYENREDNIAFERWVDVTARLMVKYGPGLLKRLEKSTVLYIIDYDHYEDDLNTELSTSVHIGFSGYTCYVNAA